MVQRSVATPPPTLIKDTTIYKGAVLKYLSGDKLHVMVNGGGQFTTVLQQTDGSEKTISRTGKVHVLFAEDLDTVFNQYVEGFRREGLTLVGCYGKKFKRRSNG